MLLVAHHPDPALLEDRGDDSRLPDRMALLGLIAEADMVLVNDSFAALAPAVLEGQRILNGMQAILKLFLARISALALVSLSALVIGIFPLALRNGTVITLLTVGIPSVALALWARPGVRPRTSLARDLLHFVVPAATFSSLLGLVVFYGTLLRLEVYGLRPGTPPERVIAASVPMAQTALATFLVHCGLFLVIFVAPPTQWWAGGGALSGDWRPTLLAVALMLAFLVISALPALRAAFALQPLERPYALWTIVALGIWLFLVRLFWRKRLIERFLGVGEKQ